MADGPCLLVCQIDMAETGRPNVLEFNSYAERSDWMIAHSQITGHYLFWGTDRWPTPVEMFAAFTDYDRARAQVTQFAQALSSVQTLVATLAPPGS
jgi:hypothetical protein